jgi:cytoskeleton protein RodZ
MADIGSTLRETRMRERIDITTVESATKIRAKYLRALENEEWDQLPGPTFVRTFLRTYAEYLGLDPKMLVEEYKQRFERPGPQDLTPLRSRSTAGGRRPPRPPRVIPPWVVLGVCVVLLLVALFALGKIGDDDPDSEAVATPVPTATAKPKGQGQGKGKGKPKPAVPKEVVLRVLPEAEVYVCVEDGDGKVLVPGEIITEETDTFRAPRMRVTFGNGQVQMRFNGKTYDVDDTDAAIGYELTPGDEPQTLPEDELPTCT